MAHRLQGMTGIIAAAVSVVIAQPAAAQTTQINQIQINSTNGTLDVRLETADGAMPQTFTTRYGETVVIDVINTQLNLPTGDTRFAQANQRIVQDNPAEGIDSIRIEPLDANSVRITVTGRDQSPTATLTQDTDALVLNVSAPEAVADRLEEPPEPTDEIEPDESPPAQVDEDIEDEIDESVPESDAQPIPSDTIQIVVTGEQDDEADYLVPDSTTGTRTDTPIFEIPQAIQVIPERVLEDQQVIRLNDALRNTPNALQSNTFGGTRDEFVIRGFEQSTILRDGFRTNDIGPGFSFEELANVERIEVLRGPASILFGNIEPGGVINLVTKAPLLDPYYNLEFQAGSFGLVRPQIDVSGPLADDWQYRLNTVYERSNGFRDDFNRDTERFFIAPVLRWEIDPDTEFILELEYLDDQRPFDRGIPAFGDEVADVPIDTVFGEPDDFAEVQVFNVGYRFEHQFSDRWQIRNRFRYTQSDLLTLRADPNGLDESTGTLFRAFSSNDNRFELFEVQTEVVGEFATGPVNHTLLAGFDLFFAETTIQTTVDFASPVNIFDPEIGVIETPEVPLAFTANDSFSDLDRIGIFVQDQIELFPRLNLLLGGRFDFVSQQSESDAIFIPGVLDSPALDVDRNEEEFSPRVGIVFQPIDPLYLYASYSQAFQPNTLSQTTIEGEFLEPEEAEQFEIGLKANFLAGRLAATLAFFDLELRNVATTDPTDPNFVTAIGEQSSRGVELDIQGEILPGWNIIASYGFLDAEIEESEDFPEGAQPRNAAENTASLFTTYEIQTGSLQGLGFGLGFFYVGDRFGDDANTFELDSYLRTDLALFYRRDRLQLGLNFQNLFDVEFFESAVGRDGANPGAPFSVVGRISYEF
ncbi:MAG: TonB-dependent siderophore receptor [Elainellaceae cyanobacterium]